MMQLDLQTFALDMLREGLVQATEEHVTSAIGSFQSTLLESGLLQRSDTLVQFPHPTF